MLRSYQIAQPAKAEQGFGPTQGNQAGHMHLYRSYKEGIGHAEKGSRRSSMIASEQSGSGAIQEIVSDPLLGSAIHADWEVVFNDNESPCI